VSDDRWRELVAEAERRAGVLAAVAARVEASGQSLRSAVADVAPELHWSTYLHWRRSVDGGEGPTWERLLDGRVPPVPDRVPDDVRLAACMVRRVDPSMNAETARTHLVAQFGESGGISDASLRRIWADAELRYVAPDEPRGAVAEEVEEFHGGGGLALLAAADSELGASLGLARAVQKAGELRAGVQATVEARTDIEVHRDDEGHFTPEYNGAWRAEVAPGEADARWTTDTAKRRHVELSALTTLKMRATTLSVKLLSMGVMPMLTERRGFAGLDGPVGAWLGVLGGTAYMPATLDKALWELGMLGVDDALWDTHGLRWSRVSRRWTESEPSWLQHVWYIDGTAEPYWTKAYAKSGPVSRVGRTMPCLTRIAVTSGAGVPVLVETYAGAASLKTHLIPVLKRLDAVIGTDAEVGRLTVVDSEVGTAGLMWALHETADRIFITVIKGNILKGATLRNEGPWMPYRERDELREVAVDLNGKHAPAEGITVRGVEMRRPNSRRPTTTLFATNADAEEFSTAEIATAYLARWPLQEQLFRDTRNGGGLNRSHGFGGEHVTHVALDTKKEQAKRRLATGEARQTRAEATRERLDEGTRDVAPPVRKDALRLADQDTRRAERTVRARQAEQVRAETMPAEIYERNTGRDSTMTCLKLHVLMLAEFVLREYFGGLNIEWRTFIEHFVMLPVTVRTTNNRCLYQLHVNPRQPERMAQLAKALDEINRRRIRRDDRLLVFELVGVNESGST